MQSKIEDGDLVVRIPLAECIEAARKDLERKKATALLSAREMQIFEMMRKNLVHKEIAAALGVATKTVKTHATEIFRKLQCESRAELLYKFGFDGEAR